MNSRLEEVKWGEAQEMDVLKRWLRISPAVSLDGRVIKSRQAQDWDYLVLDEKGYPVAYVEIKVRRVRLAEFGDAVAPIRKHEMAVSMKRRHNVPMLMVVQYACGTLVECDLAVSPKERRPLQRRDRTHQAPVLHGFWMGDQLTVVDEAA